MENPMIERWYDLGVLPKEAREMRIRVFCEEQGFTVEEEFDQLDASAYHIVLFDGDRPIATGRMYQDEDGTMHIGRIAVEKERRGTGTGRILMEKLLARSLEIGTDRIVLSAQCRVIPFYKKMGFCTYGEPYMDGHVLHQSMYLTPGG